MGVQCRIVVYGRDRASTENAAAAAFAEVARLDAIMSDYRPESEVSRLSKSPEGEMIPISADLASVLTTARLISQASDGAFDVTAGPYVALWREARKQGRLPHSEELALATKHVGWRSYSNSFNRGEHLFVTLVPDLKIDLGAIAKGYAAQRAVEILRALDHPCCLVALSGDIVTGHAPPDTSGWIIRTPDGQRVALADAAISTSGDERQYVEIQGIRYSHIIDPRTGLGAIAPRPTCTVIANRGELADALSTAGYLVGRDGWPRLEREIPGCRVIWGQAENSKPIPIAR